MTTHTTLRITRRGRVVLAALIALPVLVVSLFLATPGAVAESTGTQDTYEYVTVLAGDTLWTIAESIAPQSDPRDVIHEIMTLNQLSSAALTPGQEIAIPRS
jgi:LysM repeat protein